MCVISFSDLLGWLSFVFEYNQNRASLALVLYVGSQHFSSHDEYGGYIYIWVNLPLPYEQAS